MEKEDIVQFVATEATPAALVTREIKRQSELDPELQSVRYYIETGDWSKCKFYARRQDCNPLYSAQEGSRSSSRGTPRNCQDKESFKDKRVVAQDGQ